mmetsp:Transcript_38100/g.55947  ORF Transcript_38100/g.55947 Transcript_38100/m.55947 type:complete len:160 (-) Transcript_38100:161-640(-)
MQNNFVFFPPSPSDSSLLPTPYRSLSCHPLPTLSLFARSLTPLSLQDIATRRTIIDKVDVEAKNLLDTVTAKMVEWEGKLVALGNAKDKAKSLMDAAKLEREKLNGEKTVLGTAEKEGEAAAKVMIPPYEREIYVIAMIKKKILDHCNSGGRENTEQTN